MKRPKDRSEKLEEKYKEKSRDEEAKKREEVLEVGLEMVGKGILYPLEKMSGVEYDRDIEAGHSRMAYNLGFGNLQSVFDSR